MFGSQQFGDTPVVVGLLIGLAIIVFNVAVAWLGWTRRRYFVGDEDVRVESGIFSRDARSVPYERIQDVSLEQKLIPRILGLTSICFETGAGGKDELKLSFVTQSEGERLRTLVRERREDHALGSARQEARAEAATAAAGVAEPESRLLFTMGPGRLALFGLFEFSLIIFALLAGALQQLDSFLPYSVWSLDDWRGFASSQMSWIGAWGVVGPVIVGTVVTITIGLIGLATGIARTVARDWGFTLERNARGFRRRRGLFTRTDVVMPVHRVQAARITTGCLRRLFGWHGLKFISLAQDSGSESHVVAPFAQMDEIWPIVREAGLSAPPADARWHLPKSDRWVVLGILGAIPVLAMIAFLAMEGRWLLALAAGLVVLPMLGLRQYFSFARHRYAVGVRQIFVREGLVTPELVIAQQIRLQTVEIARGPLGRWLGYCTVHFGLAGGKLSIPGVPIAEAFALRESVLNSIAAVDFSDLPQ
nr:PH domain-containing protein [Altericroceibacterium indicum]